MAQQTYGDICARMELVVRIIVEAGGNSDEDMAILACALMNAPSDFDRGSTWSPFKESRSFLSKQPKEVQAVFVKQCRLHPSHDANRVQRLLGK